VSHLIATRNVNILTPAKRLDLLYAHDPSIDVVVGTYDQLDVNYINYGVLAQLKDGHYIDGKFESTKVGFKKPHVIIFANYPPRRAEHGGLTNNKYLLYKITDSLGPLVKVDIESITNELYA